MSNTKVNGSKYGATTGVRSGLASNNTFKKTRNSAQAQILGIGKTVDSK
jgi:hypothetical protein